MKTIVVIALIVILSIGVVFAAAPYAPTSVDTESSSRRTVFGSGSQTVNAQAGNVSQITISTTTLTRRWQGYYGNITGSVTLDNANNWTMYAWGGIANPEGEIYAANSTVTDWSTVACINFSTDHPGYNCSGRNEQCLNISEIELGYGMGSTDADGVDETFNQTLGQIIVGDNTLANCSLLNLYVNSTPTQTPYWNETMLTINDTSTIIYAAIVRADTYGFNNETSDFQMIVGENGDIDAPTPYYFYVELT